jgi:hypothetical protein
MQQHCYHHAPKVKPVAATADVEEKFGNLQIRQILLR